MDQKSCVIQTRSWYLLKSSANLPVFVQEIRSIREAIGKTKVDFMVLCFRHALCNVGTYAHFQVLVLTAAERRDRCAWQVGTAEEEDAGLFPKELFHDDHFLSL